MPGRRLPEPSLLRSHPPTGERTDRLLSLYTPEDVAGFDVADSFGLGGRIASIPPRPRWRITGLWH